MSLANATLTTSDAAIFTCTNPGGALVSSIIITNYDASARTVTLYARPFGETAADENMILKTLSIAAGDTVVVPPEYKLELGIADVISGLASANTAIIVTISYINH